MNTNTKLPLKKFYLILISCSVIIFAASLDVMFRVKDIQLFDSWLTQNEITGNRADLFSNYVSLNLSVFVSKIIVPVSFAIYTYFAYVKIRINQLYVFMWIVLNLGGLAYTIIEFNFASPMYYLMILSYAVCIMTLVTLVDDIRANKSK